MDMVAKLDNLYPKLRNCWTKCHLCGRRTSEIHHIIGRQKLLLRFDIRNLLPLCADCHRLIHDKSLNLSFFIPTARWLYLEQMSHIQFQDYLLGHGLTRDEFFKQKEKELKEIINGH